MDSILKIFSEYADNFHVVGMYLYHNIIRMFGKCLKILCEFPKYTFRWFCRCRNRKSSENIPRSYNTIPSDLIYMYIYKFKFDLSLATYRNALRKVVIMYALRPSLGIFSEYLLTSSRWQFNINNTKSPRVRAWWKLPDAF